MRYDSDPQVVKRILVEAEALHDSLNRFGISEETTSLSFDELTP